jgi:ABC-type transport system substrate-binding protein
MPGLRVIPAIFAAISSLWLASCGGGQEDSVRVIAIGEPASVFETGARLPIAAQLLRGATAEGLVTLDEQGRVVPGIAERWIVTDDGLSYIFRLRDGGWSNGTRFTSEAARQALTRAVAALRGTPLGQDFAAVRDIRAMTGRVIEVRLHHPQPEMLQLLAQPELGLLNRGAGAGPMRVRRDGDVAYLTPVDPDLRGLPAEEEKSRRPRPVRFAAMPAAAAVASFGRGEASAILGGRFEHFPLADTDGLTRAALRIDPVFGLFGLAVVHSDGFLADPANREAIAMTIDREALAARLGVAGWVATNRTVPPGLEDSPALAERWDGLTLAERRSDAAARVARWRGGSAEAVTLRIAMPRGPGADRVFAALQSDLAAIGLSARKVGPADPADLRLVDAVARYPRAGWFLNHLRCSVQRGALCEPAVDALADRAAAAATPAEHAALIAEAEARLNEANVFIALGAPIRWSLLRGNATGFAANRLGYHPLMPMALRPN